MTGAVLCAERPAWMDDAQQLYEKSAGDMVHRNPNNPDQWIRQCDLGQKYKDRYASLPPERQVIKSEQHLAYLEEEFGFGIPRREHYLAERAFCGVNSPTLYSAVNHVEGEFIRGYGTYSEEATAALWGLVRTLDAYRSWVEVSGQKVGLGDVARMRQYIYGTQSSYDSPRLYMVDVEPVLVPTRQGSQGWQEEYKDIRYLQRQLSYNLNSRVNSAG